MPRHRRRRSTLYAPEAIRGVLARAERSGATPFRPNLAASDWEAVVGVRIAERTRPLELEGSILTVRVATSVWASELSLLAQPILERLRQRGIDVRTLRCRVGDIPPPLRPKAMRPALAIPPPAPLPAALERLLATVEDGELRATIAAAARANLAWQAYVEEPLQAGGAGATNATSRAARVPRSVERESDPPDQRTGAERGEPRRRP